MDLKPPCEISVRYVLPAVRFLLAKKLIEGYGFTQSHAARVLGVTQAAISHYVNVKRGGKWVDKLTGIEEVNDFVERYAKKLASGEAYSEDLDFALCDLCRTIRRKIGYTDV